MEELKKLIEQLTRAHEEFKSANDQRLAQIEKKGHADPLLEEKVNKANSDIDKISKSIDELKTAFARVSATPALPASEEKAQQILARKQAFDKLLRKGEQALTAEEVKTLSTSSDPNGGYLVTPEVEAGIIRNMAAVNSIRSLANVRQISMGNTLEQKRRTAGISATWVGEAGSNPSAANQTFGMLRITAHEMRARVDATAQVLEDSAFNLESMIQEEAAEAFGNAEGDAFVDGDGIGKPRGILTYASGTSDGQVEQVNSGSAATVADADGQANGLITMVHKLKAAYAKSGKFVLNRLTVGAIRKLKDADKGYIWAPGLADAPPTILGYGYVEDDNMPVEGAGNLIVVFGDFKKFYKIVDKVGMSVTRDPYTAKPDLEYLFRKRVGGDVEIFEAAKILKCSA